MNMESNPKSGGETDSTRPSDKDTTRGTHLWFVESLNRINTAIIRSTDLEQLIGNVLEESLDIFQCDRTWILYPCDPEVSHWKVPFERTREGFLEASIVGESFEMFPSTRAVFQHLLADNKPITAQFGPGELAWDADDRYRIRSLVIMAIKPRLGSAWALGAHHCTHAKNWTKIEQDLLQEIGSRIADGLTSVLVSRNLRESEERVRAIFHNSAHYLGLLEPDGTVIEANQCALELVNGDIDTLRGQYFWQTPWWNHSQELQGRLKASVEAAAQGDSSRYDVTHISAVGEIHHVDFSLKPVRASTGEVVRLVADGSDITDKKRAEEDRNRLRILLENVFDSMPSFLVGVDRDGIVTHWNATTAQETGISAEEARGRQLQDVLPFLRQQLDKVREAIETRTPQKSERVPRWKSDRVDDVTVYPLAISGGKGAVIRVDDVTERVRLEENIVQTEKMASIGGLAAGMAHEINNPLAGILQGIQVIQNRLRGDFEKNFASAEQCKTTMDRIRCYAEDRGIDSMLRNVIESAERASQIVSNMLSFSRKGGGELSAEKINVILENSLALAKNDYDLGRKYDFRKIEILREYSHGEQLIRCNAGELQQVLLNLFKNGAQAMVQAAEKTAHPQFRIRTRIDEDKMLRLEISDNGPGMPPDIKRRVFEPFFTTKEIGAGTGLGLSVSYFIITKNHNGEMYVDSTPGVGTTFTIRLNLEQ